MSGNRGYSRYGNGVCIFPVIVEKGDDSPFLADDTFSGHFLLLVVIACCTCLQRLAINTNVASFFWLLNMYSVQRLPIFGVYIIID